MHSSLLSLLLMCVVAPSRGSFWPISSFLARKFEVFGPAVLQDVSQIVRNSDQITTRLAQSAITQRNIAITASLLAASALMALDRKPVFTALLRKQLRVLLPSLFALGESATWHGAVLKRVSLEAIRFGLHALKPTRKKSKNLIKAGLHRLVVALVVACFVFNIPFDMGVLIKEIEWATRPLRFEFYKGKLRNNYT